MTNTDKPYIKPTRQTAESPDESTYIVAVNDQGQYAVWPAELGLPAGWLGWAHSIEVWEDRDLIGGAIGIGVGLVLSGDWMYSRRPNAARIAVADMAARFAQAGGALIDAQRAAR
jgi:Leucyl/phenylalanyl-tRNA protein transferase/MbtH-like protein